MFRYSSKNSTYSFYYLLIDTLFDSVTTNYSFLQRILCSINIRRVFSIGKCFDIRPKIPHLFIDTWLRTNYSFLRYFLEKKLIPYSIFSGFFRKRINEESIQRRFHCMSILRWWVKQKIYDEFQWSATSNFVFRFVFANCAHARVPREPLTLKWDSPIFHCMLQLPRNTVATIQR